ncbi:acetyl-CoA transporter [Penicillium hordei]|jgi:hypothetical protein|uniref:Acetyl-CoA transporter n=1 Tax=Penicillium hordei TaxID=40994 RepID=A0AAD6GT44_9EURO|nr:acetyl-CoA transporter [Penicillium hordei]KAJ5589138.1 acetyl-CoA transporter [Penicillium hordei]
MQHDQVLSPIGQGHDTRQWTYWRNMTLLFLLYFSQGVIAGLVGGTFPVVLRERLSYGRNGLFSIALYPYSLKALWSPLIDAMRNRQLGHRKGWIVPALVISGLSLLILGLNMPLFMKMILSANAGVVLVVTILLVVVLASATQGAAADGWALELFSRDHAHHVSITHHLGMVLGEFFSYSAFLWIASLRSDSPPQAQTPNGIDHLLSGFVTFCALINLGLALPCVLSTPEVIFPGQERQTMSVKAAYKRTLELFGLKPLLMTTLVHLLSQISFEAHDAATNLKLLDQGFGEANLAIVSTIDLVMDMLSSYSTKFLCVKFRPLELWCWAFVGRTIAVLLAQLIIALNSGPRDPNHPLLFALVVVEHACSTSTATIMFVSFLTFHLQVSDPAFGSTYLTLLAT